MSEFMNEVNQIPEALMQLSNYYRNSGTKKIYEWIKKIRQKNRIIFTGMGTSEFAPYTIISRLDSLGIESKIIDTGEWLHYGPTIEDDKSIVIAISQSGQSIEIEKLIQSGKIGKQYIAISNNEDSLLSKNANLYLPIYAGYENSVTTKTYSNTLGLLHILVTALQENSELNNCFDELEIIANKMKDVDKHSINEAMKLLLPCSNLFFVGRGPTLTCAKQCALTFMEGARIATSALTGGAFRHGPMEVVEKGFKFISFLPGGSTDYLIEGLAESVQKLGAQVVIFTNQRKVENNSIKYIRTPYIKSKYSEELFSLSITYAQNLSLYFFAKAKGIKKIGFRYGNKITKQE